MPSPYSQTCQQFSEDLLAICGRGKQHAALLYQEFWQKGTCQADHPAFANAAKLRDVMVASSNFSKPEIVNAVQQENLQQSLRQETIKFLIKTEDQLEIESVIIPMQAGLTLCVSSQVGCRLGCTFCETGKMGLVRHLTVQEITGQLWAAKHFFCAPIRNVVFMGMGEPFDNYDNVMDAVRVMIDPHGAGIAPRHITVSTSGRLDGIERFEQETDLPIHLAFSLNAPNEQIRRRIMPITRKYNLTAIYEALDRYTQKTGKQVMIAYVLLKGINDQIEHAEQLARYLSGLSVKINLIPYNPQRKDLFSRPDEITCLAFKNVLQSHGYRVLLRLTKGDDIMAACGQLGNRFLSRTLRGNARCKKTCT